MSEYRTFNPVPSIDPRDLDDNATVFDKLLHLEVPTVDDRLLAPRLTWWQMEENARSLISPNIQALAGLTGAADTGVRFTGVGAMATYSLTTLGRTLAGLANAAAGRTALQAMALTDTGAYAGSAAKLTTPRTIAATGDATWSTTFDGSGNVTAALTLAATGIAAGSYGLVTVDSKGRVTNGTVITPIVNGGTGQSTVAGHLADLVTAGAYSRTSVLGTVSQTGSVPTGALMETGGTLTGTGKYFKYADGRLTTIKTLAIATGSTTAKGSIFGSAATTAGSFPVAYVGDVPVVQHSGTDAAGGGWSAMDIFPTMTAWGSYSTRAHVSQGTSGTIYLTAEGRWF